MKYACENKNILPMIDLAEKHIPGSAVYSYGQNTRINTPVEIPQKTLEIFKQKGYDLEPVTN
jgi:hypothetical protein